MKRFCAVLVLPLLLCPATAQSDDSADISAANIRAHMAFLASDRLRGREAGTPEYEMAASYVAAQMKGLGLVPAGGQRNGERAFFQHVPLVAYRPKGQGMLVTGDFEGHIRRDTQGRIDPLVFGKDYIPGANPLNTDLKLHAQVVFVGFGLVAPEHGRDDYRGLDVKGTIVAALSGAPKFLQSEERAYYSSGRVKLAEARARGAVGFISINTRTSEKLYPFANRVRQYRSWGMTWRKPDGKPFVATTLPVLANISVAGARGIFGWETDQILAAAETKSGTVKGSPLSTYLKVELHSEIRNVESENIMGVFPGSDPKLKNEYVVLSAHLDHIGVTPPVKGDSINNGALDNASGVATTLEVARLLRFSKAPPRRSVLFLIDTAEEKGLIGADYFARNPTVPRAAIVADVDLDMPILTYDFTDVVAFGAGRSSIGPAVQRAAARLDVKLSPDPAPDEGIFTRSDHYRFVEQGVPAVFLATGYANGGEAATKFFMKNNYHKPSDDLSQAIRYEVGAKFARLNYEITRELADGAKSAWNKGDFFASKFAK